MAEDNAEGAGSNVTQMLSQLERQSKVNSLLIFITMGISLLVTIALIVWIAVIGLRLQNMQPPSIEQIDKNLNEVDIRLSSLFEQMLDQDQKMNAINIKIQALAERQTYEEIAIVQRILVSQQDDFDSFLQLMDSGITNLATMVKGSRAWLRQYSKGIASARDKTKERIKAIENLQPAAP